MTNKLQRAFWGLALAGGIGLAASQANAYFLYPNDVTNFEDNDIELLVNANGGTDTLLQVGDRLRGVLSIDALTSGSGLFPTQGLMGGSSANLGDEEITGIFEIEVITATQNPDGTWDFVFGPSAAFQATYGAGAVLAIYNETPGDLVILTDPTSCDKTSQAFCEARATDGSLEFVFGFGDADAQWDATGVASNDVSFVAAGSASTEFGDYNFALDLLQNNSGFNVTEQTMACVPFGFFTCAGDGQIELIGSGTINGGAGLQSGYDARSDFQFSLASQAVPEPSSLALLGLGLVLAASLRRRKV